ncbi:MAG TPA: helix-turn-helix domain-containing protein [Hyphomicrobiales bacterium]|nr:helix-turn-helix domain-containing protein [Hyphomicrobiales bacterium]
MMIVKHGGETETRVVDQFEATDLGTPFKVVLHDAVKVTYDKAGNAVSYAIPDLDGLLKVIVINRVLHPLRFSGGDVRFIRKAIDLKQKDLASVIEVSPEHLSRCENGALPMSPSSEKLMRVFALKTALKLHKLKDCEAKTKLEDALDKIFEVLKPVAVRDAAEQIELHFSRKRRDPDQRSDGGEDDGPWDGDLAKAA